MNTSNQPQSSSLSSSNNDNEPSRVLFTEDFIVATAKVFKLNTDHLRDTLTEAAECYRIDSAYFRRLDQWLEAKYILRETLRHAERAQRTWRRASSRSRNTFTDFFYGSRTAQDIDVKLEAVVDSLAEVVEFASMPPGNTGKSRSNPDIDLNHFRSMVLCLDDLWLREKGTHLGHNFLEDLPDDDEDQAKGRIVGALGDAGLLFVQHCLRQIEPTLTRKICSSLIRSFKQCKNGSL